jgi:hypothetical protein
MKGDKFKDIHKSRGGAMNHRKKVNAWQVSVFTAVTLLASPAFAQNYQTEDLKSFLQEFHANPIEVMEQVPVKKGSGQNEQATVIPEEAVEGNQFIEAKDQYRSKVCKLENGVEVCADQLTGRAGIQGNDRAENLVDMGSRTIKTLSSMDKKGLHSAELSVRPWSDDYWAIYKGVLAYRYGDPNKTDGTDWKVHTDYVKENPSDLYIGQGFDGIQYLSPAEKYDLLVGDKSETLTKKMLNEGRSYYQNQGKVETWMGICHGWAPAAYMLDRPTSQVNVVAADGKTVIPFFPSDIKALGSLLYANVQVYNNFVGGRCNAKDPKRDSESGRIKDQECFDTNPGTWHKSVVNQIAIADRSFVMDATFDYEVWNQPVYAYSYRYFNPETFETSRDDYKEVAVDVVDFKKDKFKKYRSRKAKKIVGVEMEVQYIAETHPNHRTYDNKDYDYVTTVRYRYDLELDGRGSIVGGEWYSNKHPDFLWTPRKDARALTRLDKSIVEAINSGRTDVEWKDGEPVPSVWRQYISQYSRQGQPLGLVVEGLIKRSRAAAER